MSRNFEAEAEIETTSIYEYGIYQGNSIYEGVTLGMEWMVEDCQNGEADIWIKENLVMDGVDIQMVDFFLQLCLKEVYYDAHDEE